MSLINLSKFSLRKKIIINLFASLAVILALLFFIILPTIKKINQIGYEIEAQRVELEKKFIKAQNLKQLSKNLNEIKFELAKLDQVFINKDNELEFITALEKIAAANKIDQKINFGNEDKIYKKIPIQLLTQGNFADQLNYSLNLESMNCYINIKSLEISAVKIIDSNAKGLIQMNILADTYWR